MSTARDEGLAALQSGDIETAITRLEAAVQEDPSDFDACLFLGGAYGQAGRPLDAIKSVTQAVQLQPANAQARYNLGVAMEQGGYQEQALQVYSQALQLQPDYPKAQEAIDRLHANSNQGFGAPVSASSSTIGSGAQFQESPAQATQQQTQQFAQPPALAQPPPQQTPYNALAPTPESSQQTQGISPPAQQPPAFARPTIPVGTPQQPVEAGLGSYMAPPPPAARPPAGYGAPSPYGARPGAYSSAPAYDDEFKLGQAFKDFFRAIFTPRVLFSEMAGCETTKSAWALLVIYVVFTLIFKGISMAMLGSSTGAVSPVLAVASVLGYVVGCLVTWVVFALIVHMLSHAFGSSLRYGASFRCVMYSAAPFIATTFVLSIVMGATGTGMKSAVVSAGGTDFTTMSQAPSTGGSSTMQSAKKGSHSGKSSASGKSSPKSADSSGMASVSTSPFGAGGGSQYGNPGSSAANPFAAPGGNYGVGSMSAGPGAANPFASLQAMAGYFAIYGAILLVGALWGVILLGVAVSIIHEVSGGAGAGVAILSAIIALVLDVGIYILFIGVIMAAVVSSMAH